MNEIKQAEIQLIRYEQRRVYPELYDALLNNKQVNSSACPKRLRKFAPALIDGLIRVKGRLNNEAMDSEITIPIMLPSNSYLTILFVSEYHQQTGHSDLNHTFTALRERFWIEKPSFTIRKVLN